MRTYRSHKVVEAGKVVSVAHRGNAELRENARIFVAEQYEPEQIAVGVLERIEKMAGEAGQNLEGGWLIRYRDGYVSWSPASEFEAGYEPYNVPGDGDGSAPSPEAA